ncbi:MAG TPA: thermopsin, partial [Thermoplasmata archaeon]|nr:thermopsin [Thermoplasmata archaeon]
MPFRGRRRGARGPSQVLFLLGVLVLVVGGVTPVVLARLGPEHAPGIPPRTIAQFGDPVRPAVPAHPGVHLHPGAVVPAYGGGYSEPAPMGIADFGVTPLGAPYSYTTDQWLGTVQIGALKVTSGGPGANGKLGFQLNVVLVLSTGSGNLSYWVQNVVSIDSKTETIGFVDNIWNFSSPSAGLSSPELAGNGTVYDSAGFNYYAVTDPSFTNGNGIQLTLPTTVQAKVTTADFGGVPEVTFLFNDGFGWAAYDNVSFTHGGTWTDLGFAVDGYAYAPISPGIYTDGEWDFTGAGSAYTDVLSNLSMGLAFWNGHNFQSPPNAWNFGGNTGESMKSVIPRFEPDNATGALAAREVNGSGGSLGPLYGSSQVAEVEFEAPAVPNGTIQLGAGNYSYAGGLAHLVLAPGSYRIQLWNASVADGLLGWLNLTGGESTVVQLPVTLTQYAVGFHVSGLPAQTRWGVRWEGLFEATTSTWLNFSVPNGTYPYLLGAVAGYTTGSYRSTVSVEGVDQVIAVRFTVFTFATWFAPSGLPNGTAWSVQVSGLPQVDGVAPSPLRIPLSNGTWFYNVSTVAWYAAEPTEGNVSIAGVAPVVPIQFGPAPSTIVGTVTPIDAQL